MRRFGLVAVRFYPLLIVCALGKMPGIAQSVGYVGRVAIREAVEAGKLLAVLVVAHHEAVATMDGATATELSRFLASIEELGYVGGGAEQCSHRSLPWI